MGRLKGDAMEKSYIWSIPTRVFHSFFVLFILLAFLTDDDDWVLKYHIIAGYAILILLVFRFFWGFIGPRYSLFKDFPLGKENVKEFLSNIFDANQKYIGHNPLASYVMFAMLIVTFLTVITGILTLGIQEGKGILAFLNSSFFKEMKLFKNIHDLLSSVLIALIIAHISGVVFDRLFHSKHETLKSIVTGFKVTQENESIKLNIFQKLFAFFAFVAFITFLIFSLYQPKNILTASIHKEVDYKVQNPLFEKECAACHILYPPNLMPKKSWELMMGDLENHFGDDASIDEESNKNILAFLVKNSAETSTMQASWNFLNSIGDKDIIALTKTTFWEKKHKDIPKELFENKEIKSKANCKACHSDIEKGLIENENIKNLSDFK